MITKSLTCNQQCRIWTYLGFPVMYSWAPWDHRPVGAPGPSGPLGPNGPGEGLTGNTTNAFCARIYARRLGVGVLLGQAASCLVIDDFVCFLHMLQPSLVVLEAKESL